MTVSPTLPTLYVISGAGLSAASGLSTYRDKGGVWTKYDMNEVCHISTFSEHREKAFSFYNEVRESVLKAQPNAAHQSLAQLQNRFFQQVQLLTQNVDDLFERAGALSVTHLHGHLQSYHCAACNHEWPLTGAQFSLQERCPRCDSLRKVKPAVVLFGQAAPEYKALSAMHKQCKAQDVVLVVGTAFEVLGEHDVVPRVLWESPHAINANLNNDANPGYFGANLLGSAPEVIPALCQRLEAYLSGQSTTL